MFWQVVPAVGPMLLEGVDKATKAAMVAITQPEMTVPIFHSDNIGE